MNFVRMIGRTHRKPSIISFTDPLLMFSSIEPIVPLLHFFFIFRAYFSNAYQIFGLSDLLDEWVIYKSELFTTKEQMYFRKVVYSLYLQS